MPRGDKTKYSAKQKRKAQHIEEGYEERGVPLKEAERRAWATVNKMHGGGSKGGSGTDKIKDPSPAEKGGKIGGKKQAQRPASQRSASAKKAAQTRKKNQKS
ncbi:MAG: plasmid stabilization protein [Alphaproteobacteria bacterium 41-28]|nr:MAG: plasmid stabilization protein [Alphaproteobacteria bacterium 41-28]